MSRKPSSLAMAAMLVVVVCVPGGATAVVHDTDATMLDPSRSDIVWATKFRTTFALDASPTTVERAADDGQAYPDMTWGVPLSRAEADTLHQRLWLVLSTLPAVELARKDPAWAGWWLDHESGGTPVLLFAADPAEKRAGLADRLPAGVEVRVERVERPLTDLEAMRHKLFASEADLTKAGTVLTAVGLDIVGNRLTIGVEASSRSTRDAIADLIGDAFVLREEGAAGADSCPRTECLPPLKAGVGLQDQSGAYPNNTPCTVGYLARRTDTSPDKLVVVTAGHCIYFLPTGQRPFRHGTIDIGNPATKNGNDIHTWVNWYNADVGLVNTGQLQPNMMLDRNNILVSRNPDVEVSIGGTYTHENTPVGLPVCRMGYKTYLKCGEIKYVDETKKSAVGSAYRWIDHTVVYTVDAEGGDSGAPVWFPIVYPYYIAVLLGTHVHSWDDEPTFNPDKNGWYSPWDRGVNTLANELGVTITPCLTTSCDLP